MATIPKAAGSSSLLDVVFHIPVVEIVAGPRDTNTDGGPCSLTILPSSSRSMNVLSGSFFHECSAETLCCAIAPNSGPNHTTLIALVLPLLSSSLSVSYRHPPTAPTLVGSRRAVSVPPLSCWSSRRWCTGLLARLVKDERLADDAGESTQGMGFRRCRLLVARGPGRAGGGWMSGPQIPSASCTTNSQRTRRPGRSPRVPVALSEEPLVSIGGGRAAARKRRATSPNVLRKSLADLKIGDTKPVGPAPRNRWTLDDIRALPEFTRRPHTFFLRAKQWTEERRPRPTIFLSSTRGEWPRLT